ncbi:MAG: dihydroorotase [Flavobacteriaceae bacterium]
MNVLLRSAVIVDTTNPKLHLKKRDILIKDGIIDRIAAKIENYGNSKIIELPNLHISAGWFDSSVSFGEPGFEERETIAHGLRVVARSGFTDIVLNSNTNPIPDSSGDIVFLINRNNGQAAHLYPLGAVTVKSQGKELAELYDMRNAGAVGFYDYKNPLENSSLLKIALQYAQVFKGLVFSFPMDSQIAQNGIVNEGDVSTALGLRGIPALAEELQIARDLFILEYTEGALHIPTLSTARSVELIRNAKKKGLDVTCSVAVHNLWFTDKILEGFDSNTKVLPPLRGKKDVEALRKGLKDGTIDFVTSDHTPINIEEKRIEFDNASFGTIGIENSFGILNQIYDTPTVIEVLTRGRERFGIEGAAIAEGLPACIALFDPDPVYELNASAIQSTSKNSMFVGQSLKGRAFGIYARKQLIIQQ